MVDRGSRSDGQTMISPEHRARHHRSASAGVATALCLALACLLAATAQAGTGLSVTPTFPTSSTVGDKGLPASLTIINANTGTDVSATICNSGDALPCPIGSQGITLLGSCAAQGADAACTVADNGVFAISATGFGAAGSACANVGFSTMAVAGAPGKVRFVPMVGHVVLSNPGATCRIDFTVDVLKTPATDAQPAVAGLQTIQIADASQYSNNGTTGFARGSQTGTTVKPPPPPPPPPVTPPPPPPPPAAVAPLLPSAVGTAAITGRSGCQARPFRVVVRGSQIRRVTFRLDGRKVLSLTKPDRGTRFTLLVRPGTMSAGTHRVTATASFTKASSTPARVLRVAFQRCIRKVSRPVFAG